MTFTSSENTKIRPEVGEVLNLEVLRISSGGGRGVSKHMGLVVFTPLTVPGDKIRAKVTKVKKSFCEAELVEVLKASPERISPSCPVFKDCGGCSLQMMSYEEQLKQKEGFLDFALRRTFKEQSLKVENIEPSPKQMRYRNRIQVHQVGDKVGFFKKRTHSLVDFKDCLITDQKITEHFEVLKRKKQKKRFELALDKEGRLRVSDQKLSAEESLFSQVNTELNVILIDYVMAEAKNIENLKTIFDLYAGSGNFSFPLAQSFSEAKVEAVELSVKSVEKANELNRLKNLKFKAEDVALFLKQNKEAADLVLLDPPRKGFSSEVTESLLQSKPKHIFYISCNLASATRDLELLSEDYELVKAKPFDMFPQTDHLESFFHLKLK